MKWLLQRLLLSATMLMFSCEDVENGIDGEDGSVKEWLSEKTHSHNTISW